MGVETFLRAGSRPRQAKVTYCVGTERLCAQTARVLVVGTACLIGVECLLCVTGTDTPNGASYRSGRSLSVGRRSPVTAVKALILSES
jgi:hypothetical protein